MTIIPLNLPPLLVIAYYTVFVLHYTFTRPFAFILDVVSFGFGFGLEVISTTRLLVFLALLVVSLHVIDTYRRIKRNPTQSFRIIHFEHDYEFLRFRGHFKIKVTYEIERFCIDFGLDSDFIVHEFYPQKRPRVLRPVDCCRRPTPIPRVPSPFPSIPDLFDNELRYPEPETPTNPNRIQPNPTTRRINQVRGTLRNRSSVTRQFPTPPGSSPENPLVLN